MQRRHLRGEVGDVLLRAVDHREALVQLRQIVGGLLRGRLHRLAEPVRHGVEPLVHRVLQFGLLGVQHLAHRQHLAGRLRLQARDLVHALVGKLGSLDRAACASAARRRERTISTMTSSSPPASSKAAMAAAMPAMTSGSIWARRAARVIGYVHAGRF